jgi:hypothetical protein
MNENQPDRAHWMAGAYGLMNHWLFPGVLPERLPGAATIEEACARFNVERLLEDFALSGADWLIFTLGQNTGCYCSPNSVIEELCGPGHCPSRDLALEIAQGLHRMGKRFIAYLPCEVAANRTLHAGFAWNTVDGSDQVGFQRLYTQAVAEWAQRFGELLDGWWLDGCYTWPGFHNSYMDWDLWLGAARSGNPEAVVTFNDGAFCVGNTQPVHSSHDYLSGEAEMLVQGRVRLGRAGDPPPTHLPAGRFASGTRIQWHALLPIDCFWGHGNPPPDWLPEHRYHEIQTGSPNPPMELPVYSDLELCAFLNDCLEVGGAVTLNVGIFQEGHYGKETVNQLTRIRNKLGR